MQALNNVDIHIVITLDEIDFNKSQEVICVDQFCLNKSLHDYTIAIGDFDSISNKQSLNKYKTLTYPIQKAETDLELAIIYAKEQGCKNIAIYGIFSGKRFDHLINNFLLLNKYQDLNITLCDSNNQIRIYHPGKYFLDNNYKYTSFFSLEESKIILSNDFLYSGTYDINITTLNFISNEITSKQAMFEVLEKNVIVIQSND